MKNIVLILLTGSVMLMGCVTAGPKISLANYPQLGILSCLAESAVKWQGDNEKTPGLFDLIANVKSNDNEKLDGRLSLIIGRADDLIEPAHDILRQSLAGLTGNTILAPEAITGSAAYAAVAENKSLAMVMLKPAGYHFISNLNAKTAAALKSEIKLDAGIYAEFKFEMKLWNGIGKNGTMAAITYLQVYVIDSEGKRIFHHEYAKVSSNRTPVAMGIFDAVKLKALFLESTKDACDNFVADLNA